MAAQQAGIPLNDDGELVGESDGSGFGIGPAISQGKPVASSIISIKKRETRSKLKGGKERSRSVSIEEPQHKLHKLLPKPGIQHTIHDAVLDILYPE